MQPVLNELRKRAKQAVPVHIDGDWRAIGRVRALAVTWCGELVLDDKGIPLEDAVMCLLPEDTAQHSKILREMAERTMAGALLVVRQTGNDIKAVFETTAGTTTWSYRVEDRGDRKVPIRRGEQKNVDSLGVLWGLN